MQKINEEGEELLSFEEVFPDHQPGETVRGFRLREELTQAALAEKIGVRQHHISEIENGKTLHLFGNGEEIGQRTWYGPQGFSLIRSHGYSFPPDASEGVAAFAAASACAALIHLEHFMLRFDIAGHAFGKGWSSAGLDSSVHSSGHMSGFPKSAFAFGIGKICSFFKSEPTTDTAGCCLHSAPCCIHYALCCGDGAGTHGGDCRIDGLTGGNVGTVDNA